MLKIGDFARLCRVPVKTLCYYDDGGLMTPARVGPVRWRSSATRSTDDAATAVKLGGGQGGKGPGS